MNDPATTARRERAEKHLKFGSDHYDKSERDWIRNSSSREEYEQILEAYLAGAREEAAIKDAEIAALHHRIGELEKQNDADRQDFSAEIAALNESITLQRAGIDALKRTNDKLNDENERLKEQRNAAIRVIPMESLDEIRPVLYACAAGDISGGKTLELLREWMETGTLEGFIGYVLPTEEGR